jgi:hypothetical protein
MEEQKLDKMYEEFMKLFESRQSDIHAPLIFIQKHRDEVEYTFDEGEVIASFVTTRYDNKLTFMWHYWKSNYDNFDTFDLKEILLDLEEKLDLSVEGGVINFELHMAYENEFGNYTANHKREIAFDLLNKAKMYENMIRDVVEDKEIFVTIHPYFHQDFVLAKRLGFKEKLIDNIFFKKVKKEG